MLEMYEQLQRQVAGLEEDLKKADGGNKAAGTRVRGELQNIKKLCQDLRIKILEARNDD
jgi:hypothetical protein